MLAQLWFFERDLHGILWSLLRMAKKSGRVTKAKRSLRVSPLLFFGGVDMVFVHHRNFRHSRVKKKRAVTRTSFGRHGVNGLRSRAPHSKGRAPVSEGGPHKSKNGPSSTAPYKDVISINGAED